MKNNIYLIMLCLSSILAVFPTVNSYSQTCACTTDKVPNMSTTFCYSIVSPNCVDLGVIPSVSLNGNCVVVTCPNPPLGFIGGQVWYTNISDDVCDLNVLSGSASFVGNTSTFPFYILTGQNGHLNTGDQYRFLITYNRTVACGNSAGGGLLVASGWSNSITIPSENCSNPTNIAATEVTQNSAKVTWGAVACVSSYILEYKKQSENTWRNPITVNSLSQTVSGLTAGTNYEVRVKSSCGSITPDIPTTYQFTTASLGSCLPPTGITIGSLASSSATVSWTASMNVQSYKVEYTKLNPVNWIEVTPNASSTSVTLSNLAVNTDYQVRITTNCSNSATSTSSIPKSFKTLVATCTLPVPTNVVISNIESNAAIVSWNQVANATKYKIEYKKNSDATWQSMETSNYASNRLYSLDADTKYDVQISTICSDNTTSLPSSSVFFTTKLSPICTAQNLQINSINYTHQSTANGEIDYKSSNPQIGVMYYKFVAVSEKMIIEVLRDEGNIFSSSWGWNVIGEGADKCSTNFDIGTADFLRGWSGPDSLRYYYNLKVGQTYVIAVGENTSKFFSVRIMAPKSGSITIPNANCQFRSGNALGLNLNKTYTPFNDSFWGYTDSLVWTGAAAGFSKYIIIAKGDSKWVLYVITGNQGGGTLAYINYNVDNITPPCNGWIPVSNECDCIINVNGGCSNVPIINDTYTDAFNVPISPSTGCVNGTLIGAKSEYPIDDVYFYSIMEKGCIGKAADLWYKFKPSAGTTKMQLSDKQGQINLEVFRALGSSSLLNFHSCNIGGDTIIQVNSDSTYYIRVTPKGSFNSNFSFCVKIPTCNAPIGINTSNITGTNLTVSWTGALGARDYTLDVPVFTISIVTTK